MELGSTESPGAVKPNVQTRNPTEIAVSRTAPIADRTLLPSVFLFMSPSVPRGGIKATLSQESSYLNATALVCVWHEAGRISA
jgi:hypothetical protein